MSLELQTHPNKVFALFFFLSLSLSLPNLLATYTQMTKLKWQVGRGVQRPNADQTCKGSKNKKAE